MYKEKLQKIVDKIAVKKLEDGTWKLDHTFADDFYKLVHPYARKSAYASAKEYAYYSSRTASRYDPEDATSEVVAQLWEALRRYGPRPLGNRYVDYTLKLKTQNVLTNLSKRMCRHKCKLNFIAESLDYLESWEYPIDAEHNLLEMISVKQEAEILYNKKMKALRRKQSRRNRKRKVEVAMWQTDTVTMREAPIGATYVSKYGKLFQLIGKSKTQARILVFAVDKEINVDLSYTAYKYEDRTKKVRVQAVDVVAQPEPVKAPEPKVSSVESQDLKIVVSQAGQEVKKVKVMPRPPKVDVPVVEQVVEKPKVEETVVYAVQKEEVTVKPEDTIVEVQVKKQRRQRKPREHKETRDMKKQKESKSQKASEVKNAVELVIQLLSSGEHTKKDLAKAIIAAFPDRNNKVEKVINYVSVMLSHLRHRNKLNLVSPSPGKYTIK